MFFHSFSDAGGPALIIASTKVVAVLLVVALLLVVTALIVASRMGPATILLAMATSEVVLNPPAGLDDEVAVILSNGERDRSFSLVRMFSAPMFALKWPGRYGRVMFGWQAGPLRVRVANPVPAFPLHILARNPLTTQPRGSLIRRFPSALWAQPVRAGRSRMRLACRTGAQVRS